MAEQRRDPPAEGSSRPLLTNYEAAYRVLGDSSGHHQFTSSHKVLCQRGLKEEEEGEQEEGEQEEEERPDRSHPFIDKEIDTLELFRF